MKHRCPVCKKTVVTSTQGQSEGVKFFPFCSQRCKLIDLGAWLDDKYRIPSEPQSEESDNLPDFSSDTASSKQ